MALLRFSRATAHAAVPFLHHPGPFLFGECFYLFKEREIVGYGPGVIASLAGALLSIFFFGLDRRNRQIIHLSERAMRLIEAQFLFTEYRNYGASALNSDVIG